MGFIIKQYEKNFMRRYDEDEGIPFPAYTEFPGLCREEGSFRNSEGAEIWYYTYYYEGYRKEKLILFCHGLGPGHASYTVDIERLCRAGYRVLAPDFTGCGTSGGERLSSVNAPARDAAELLELLKPNEEVIPFGHSLGGYTALTLADALPFVRRAVVISGFLSISDEMMGFVKLRLLADRVKRYERRLLPRFGELDNRRYLASTQDRILWIHSKDDPVVNYKYNAGQAMKCGNPRVRVIALEGRKHMPQYTPEALRNMNEWMGEFYKAVNEKKLVTAEEKRAFFETRPYLQMTTPDEEVFGEIIEFLDGKS